MFLLQAGRGTCFTWSQQQTSGRRGIQFTQWLHPQPNLRGQLDKRDEVNEVAHMYTLLHGRYLGLEMDEFMN